MIFRPADVRCPQWDFQVEIAGRLYATRPLTLDEVVQLAAAVKLPDRCQGAKELRDFLAGIFTEPAPVGSLELHVLLAFVGALMDYFRDWTGRVRSQIPLKRERGN